MFRSLGWQPLLLVVAFLLAISLAAVGWLLGRSRSRMQSEEDRAGSITDPIASNDASRPPTVKPTAAPETWLLATGWKRHGLLEFDERPS